MVNLLTVISKGSGKHNKTIEQANKQAKRM